MSASAKNPGLRERKKAKTRETIQHHALELFRKQGYAATTVDQIVTAAEVSESTFFRYFPTKEDVVLYDYTDPLLIAAFAEQSLELSPIQALRGAMREVFTRLPPEEFAQQWERGRLMLDVPELRMRMLDQLGDGLQLMSELLAKRLGRSADDLAIRTFSGAVLGVLTAAIFTAITKPDANILALMDESLAYLEAGLPL